MAALKRNLQHLKRNIYVAMSFGFVATSLFGFELPALPEIPASLPAPNQTGHIVINGAEGKPLETTLDGEIQERLESFIQERGSPIAAVVLANARTGEILAMAQGKSPESWGSNVHSALYAGFPAASIFKTVTAAAALDLFGADPTEEVGLNDHCGGVHPRGYWLDDTILSRASGMNLVRAFGHSCNSFFAKLAVNRVGLGTILHYAEKMGWNHEIPTDFRVAVSKLDAPSTLGTNAQDVGRFAAGFGNVHMSAVHGAALASLLTSNSGESVPLKLFRSEGVQMPQQEAEKKGFLSSYASQQLKRLMRNTVTAGTASHVFSRGKYRRIQMLAGGKTGTLNSVQPAGLATLFVGAMPLENPEVVVSAVVILQDRWVFKASQLAAEALSVYEELRRSRPLASHSEKTPELPH